MSLSVIQSTGSAGGSTLDDQQLAHLARQGDEAAFETLVRRWQTPLVAFLMRRVGHRGDAEDLFQETMLRVHRGLLSYDCGRPFRPWIFTIAWRLATNHCRDRRSARGIGRQEAEGIAAAEDGSPSHLAERQEMADNLWALARGTLETDQVAMLWLFYVESLGAREIAQVTGRSWVAVKTGLSRSRAKLRRALQRQAAGEGPAKAGES